MAKSADYKPSAKGVSRIFAGDKVMWIVIIVLLVFSLYLVYSTTAYDAATNANQELIKQILFICIGMTGFYVMQMIPIKWYRKLTRPFFFVFLMLTVVMIFTHDGKDAARALQITESISFQPFEFLKFAVIFNLASQLSSRQKQMDKLQIIPSFRISQWREHRQEQLDILMNQTLPIILPIAISCLVTLIVSNSTTLIIASSCFAMMYLSRVQIKDLGKILAVGVVVASLALGIYGSEASRRDTLISRFKAWTPNMITKSAKVGVVDKLEYYSRKGNEHDQTIYAKMSIATGEIKGKGAGRSTNRYLAEADKDMAYAFLIEEYGLIGGVIILFAFLLIFYRSMVIFQKCGAAFPGLLVLGIGTVIVLQAFMHMLVSVSLFPLTGQQLPIISKGGTSLILTLSMLGVLMGVSARAEQEEAERESKRAGNK